MTTIEEFLDALHLTEVGPDRYTAGNVEMGHGVVFGGQLLGQSIVAGLAGVEGMAVKTVHTIFARSGRTDVPVEISVDRMHAGRTFASSTVTISQGDRLVTRSLVLLSADEPDLIRHTVEPAELTAPEDAPPHAEASGAWEVRVVGGVDLSDPEEVGPAQLDVWNRFVGAPADDPGLNQALLAYATDGFLIGTAMRPHAGVGQAQSHLTLSTGVVSHTLTFHEPWPAGEWFLLSNRSPYAGHGRAYGTADIFGRDGTLVASYVQDSMIRPMPAHGGR